MFRINAALICALLAGAACAVESSDPSVIVEPAAAPVEQEAAAALPDAEAGPIELAADDASLAAAPTALEPGDPGSGEIVRTTFYSNAAKTTIVGSCYFRSCAPKGGSCSGRRTAYSEVVKSEC
jgi:hypothetical protein